MNTIKQENVARVRFPSHIFFTLIYEQKSL